MSAQQLSGRSWLEAREVGSVFGIRILLALATAFGRMPVRLVPGTAAPALVSAPRRRAKERER